MALVESSEEEKSGSSCVLFPGEQKGVPAPFLTKTYELVDDLSTDHIVSWGEDESTFVVWRPPEFARDLLPNYFKHSNFSSFVRQLNTYGFRKIVPDRWEFANDYFRKGEKALLCEIHRRKSSIPSTPVVNIGPLLFPCSSRCQQASWCGPPAVPTDRRDCSDAGGGVVFGSSLSALLEDNEMLRRSNAVLLAELAHMRSLYNDVVVYLLQNHLKPVTPSGLLRRYHAAEEEELDCCAPPTKLFGVPLGRKKRVFEVERSSASSTTTGQR